jgi:hypothetical protein
MTKHSTPKSLRGRAFGWNTPEKVVTHLEHLASNVKSDWAQSALARVENQNHICMSLLNSVLPLTRLTLHTRVSRGCDEYLDSS